MRKLILAIILALGMAGVAAAQGNDFPPFNPSPTPGSPPTIPGTPSTPGCCFSGSAWGPNTLFGVEKGDKVYFTIEMDWWGFAAPLYWFPTCYGCTSGPVYAEATDGTAPKIAQWYWGELGEFCFKCRFWMVAGDDNPTLELPFWGANNFGVHIVITGIEKAPPLVEPVAKAYTKEKARNASIVAGVISGVTLTAAAIASLSPPTYAWSFSFMLMSAFSGYVGYEFDRIANDPFDWEYQSAFYANYHPDLVGMRDWICQATYETDQDGFASGLCEMLLEANLATEAYLRAAAVTNDRMESCKLMVDSCQVWQRALLVEHMRNAGAWASWLGTLHGYWAEYLYSQGFNTEDNVTGWIDWYRYTLWDTGAAFQGVE